MTDRTEYKKKWYQDNKDRISKQQKEYRKDNEKVKEYRKAYYQANRERLKKIDAEYRKNNREAINAKQRAKRLSIKLSNKNK